MHPVALAVALSVDLDVYDVRHSEDNNEGVAASRCVDTGA
jgi:hypothetical protein